MSPTVFRHDGYRFFFFSREESRKHVHIISADGASKFWLEPDMALARNHGHNGIQLKTIRSLVEEHRHELVKAWERFFDG